MTVLLEIEAAENALRLAMLESDVAQLEHLISDGLIFVDQDGRQFGKADDLAAHASGLLDIKQLDARGEPLIRILGDSAVVCLTVELAGTHGGHPFGGAFAYTRIWHRRDDRWQVEAAHCSSVLES